MQTAEHEGLLGNDEATQFNDKFDENRIQCKKCAQDEVWRSKFTLQAMPDKLSANHRHKFVIYIRRTTIVVWLLSPEANQHYGHFNAKQRTPQHGGETRRVIANTSPPIELMGNRSKNCSEINESCEHKDSRMHQFEVDIKLIKPCANSVLRVQGAHAL